MITALAPRSTSDPPSSGGRCVLAATWVRLRLLAGVSRPELNQLGSFSDRKALFVKTKPRGWDGQIAVEQSHPRGRTNGNQRDADLPSNVSQQPDVRPTTHEGAEP